MTVKIKYCGLTEPGDVAAAMLARASYVGFVFFGASPRHLPLADAAALAASVPAAITRVALVVDASDTDLAKISETVPFDLWQLHGQETPARVADVRARYGKPVMKALGVAVPADLDRLADHERVADRLLIDAKPPEGADRPGGHGVPVEWRLLEGRVWSRPWMLAGGLTPANVAEAVRVSGAREVDVSSGVESAPGVKDGDLMRAFADALA